ncbi:hypothetical protein PNH50_11985 [Leisingera aquaemixtae]|uniref:hypothetical protein n=1 Tax=Leisingera aquaemixtae TaxID=1396826 RepID=UPI003983E6C1
MKPAFALSLSADGIALLYRAEDGWRHVGSTPFDAPDLPAALAGIRADALRLAPDGVFSKLILPEDQIRYLTLETGELPAEARIAAARAALEGATPYPVDELAFDISADGSLTHVAAVALETLDEAETFAVEHGFGPVSFVAAPEDSGFQGEPFFGTTRAIRGTEVEPDSEAVEVAGPAKLPAPVAEDTAEDSAPAPAEDTPEPSADTAAEQPAEQQPPAPAASLDPPQPPAQEPDAEAAKEDAPVDAPALPADAKAPVSLPPAPPAPAAGGSAQEGNGFSSIRSKAAAANSSAPPVQGPAPAPDRIPPPLAAKPLGAAVAAKPADQAGAAAPQPKIPPAPAALREAAAAPAPPPKEDAGKPAAKGKPRYLGVILTALLLLFMATVAVWAVFGESSFFSDTPAEDSRLAPEGAPGSPPPDRTDSPAAVVPQPGTDADDAAIAPQVSVLADQPDPGVQVLGSAADASAGEAALADLQDSGQEPSAEDEAAADGAELPDETAEADAAIPDALEEFETEEGLAAPAAPAQAPQQEPLDELALAARYAATGVWPVAPDLGTSPAAPGLDELYTASIDQPDIAADAVALPQPESFAGDDRLAAIASPAVAGADFDLDARGLVKASPKGTLNPDGITVYLGRPKKVPPRAPERSDPAAEALAEEVARNQVLSRKRPKARPADLEEQTERARLGGLSRAELASLRPRQRPASVKPAGEEQMAATALAIAASAVPRERPANFANLVDRARRNAQNQVQTAAAVPAAAAAAAPRIPTEASVARRATVNNALNLRKLNLIGVYGTASDRRALVRLPSGRYMKVRVGDRIDGGRVIAIGESQLQYQKGGRNRTLKMPNS